MCIDESIDTATAHCPTNVKLLNSAMADSGSLEAIRKLQEEYASKKELDSQIY